MTGPTTRTTQVWTASAMAAPVAGILLAADPAVRLLNAQVFPQRLACSSAAVVAALDWLLDRGPRLVNMSFGLRRDDAALRAVCMRAVDSGVLLVAASPARGDPVYPAAYPGVLRATGDARCAPGELSWLDSPQADVGAHVSAHKGPIAGASVGCARVSAALLQYLGDRAEAGRDDALAWLRSRARYQGVERRGR